MSFNHPMYLQQHQQQQQQQQHAQSLVRNQSGSEGSMISMNAPSGQNQFLPASAPVSSLLPHIPNQNGHNHNASSLQSQLAALLSNSGYSSHNNGQYGVQQQNQNQNQNQSHYGNMSESSNNKSQGAYSSNGGGSAGMANTMVPGMQNWNAERLEKHVQLLKQMKQPIPQTVALLLADARRKTEKKEAKRVANRKSACTSRARKKALVQEMTETNARLKRQALILALLPDLVIVIDVEGEITFCSAQVERVLRHKNEDLIGAKLSNLLVPSSRDALQKLVCELVESEKAAATEMEIGAIQIQPNGPGGALEDPNGLKADEDNMPSISAGSGDTSGTPAAAVVSEGSSFSLSVFKVDAAVALNENDTSDISASNGLTGECNSGSDESAKKKAASRSSVGSNSGSGCTESKKLHNANANLERNVRWHNKKMKANKKIGNMDDVIGGFVTANNASARLSSLQHLPESLSEEDSGYRESNDSREETSSSSDSSTSNVRRKPLAPTCNVCLIRDDLTTIWCEVTSSIRTKDVPEVPVDPEKSEGSSVGAEKLPSSESDSTPLVESKELLLCLRPIRDGDKKVDPKYRFDPLGQRGNKVMVSESSNTGLSSGETSLLSSTFEIQMASRPLKKRIRKDDMEAPLKKRSKGKSKKGGPSADEREKSVVESLMLMNKTP